MLSPSPEGGLGLESRLMLGFCPLGTRGAGWPLMEIGEDAPSQRMGSLIACWGSAAEAQHFPSSLEPHFLFQHRVSSPGQQDILGSQAGSKERDSWVDAVESPAPADPSHCVPEQLELKYLAGFPAGSDPPW